MSTKHFKRTLFYIIIGVLIIPGLSAHAGAPPGLYADFSYTTSDLTVYFTDVSSGGPTTWNWSFGDGGSSTLQHPTHTYATGGTYTVILIVKNPGSADDLVARLTVTEAATNEGETTSPYFNPNMGDQYATIFHGNGRHGNPALHAYCIWEGAGYLGMVINYADIKDLPNPETLSEHYLIKSSDVCSIEFYLLTSGEYQINIGPDENGTVYELIFQELTGPVLVYRTFNVNDLAE